MLGTSAWRSFYHMASIYMRQLGKKESQGFSIDDFT